MPTRSIQNPARPKPREVTHITPNSPACGGSPLLIPPRAGERKGAVMLSVHLECDAPAQSAVEAELVSEHPLTFNTVTQHDSPFLSPATAHDGGAIIWPGTNSGAQEAGGTLPPRLRGEAGREAAQHHSHQPSCCFPHAAERKGAVMLSEAKHLKSRPTKTPRSHPNLLPQCPRSASVRARRGGLRTASAALRQPGN